MIDNLYAHLASERLLELAVNLEVLLMQYADLFETIGVEAPDWFAQLQNERQQIVNELSQREGVN